MVRMLDVVESQSSELTMKQFADSQNATVTECIQKLATLPGLKPGHPLYMTGVKLMKIPTNREVLMALPHDEVRLCWLQEERDAMNGGQSTTPPC